MNGRLLVHIGLPKTATTTLQTQYFPRLPPDRYRYLGAWQPRSVQQDATFTALRNVVFGRKAAAEGVRAALARLLHDGVNVVVSEELFTVSTRENSWRAKLENLSCIIDGLDYRLLVTVRPPVAGSFSYYVEMERRFRAAGVDYLTAVVSDEAMEIYDYSKLLREIDERFDSSLVWFKRFEDVISAQMADVDRIIGFEGAVVPLGGFAVTNQKARVGGAVLTGQLATLADPLKRSFLARLVRNSIRLRAVTDPLKKALDILEHVKLEGRCISLPTESEKARVLQLLEPGWHELLKRMEGQCST